MRFLLALLCLTTPGAMASEDVVRPWSISFGLGGYSSAGATYISIAAGARYRWTNWTETLAGSTLTFGSDTYVGFDGAQRFYAPLEGNIIPWVQVGASIDDVSDGNTAALVAGGGILTLISERVGIEIGALYHAYSVFGSNRLNYLGFSGGATIRF